MTDKFISIKKYRCPIDATPSCKMRIFISFPQGLRNKDFPNEKLLCPVCKKLYRWRDLKEMDITHSI